ncbi:MAG: rRNA pseudouridine synthase [Treponemataceae bacterium]|nr:rRNA pseudouridine synthase [Treponemataceae bacterium]
MSTQRIDKLLSHEGLGTRKGVKKLLRTQCITVNGIRTTDAGTQVDPDRDEVAVDGRRLSLRANIHLMMNKPQDAVSANKDGLHRTVFDLLAPEYRTERLRGALHLVGRLDIDTEGLLVFTTDGALIHRVISPKSHLPKTYFVRLKNPETEERRRQIAGQFSAGIHIAAEDNEPEADCRSAEIRWLSSTEAELTITEGKYHQVKRMFAAAGNEVAYLKRLSIGALALDPSLAPGMYRELSVEEAALLVHGGER